MVEVGDVNQRAAYLIDAYKPLENVYFSSNTRTLLAQPPFAALLATGLNTVSAQVEESLRFASELGFKESVVVGAIPFDVNEKSYLRVSTNILSQEGKERPQEAIQSPSIGTHTVAEWPTSDCFKNGVVNALARFARGELDKVVLSRTLRLQYQQQLNVQAMVKNLAAKNHVGYTFAVDLNDVGQPKVNKTLIGASPELLISRRGNKIITHPLAGSEPRSTNPEEDHSRAQALLKSKKDLYEHELVVHAIEKALSPFCKKLSVPNKPELVGTPALWHLGTRIEGELIDQSTSSLQLALALHPTPAICGYPTHKAKNAIKEIETYDRDLFTGMVGWCDANGDGEWVVTIRCAQVEDKSVTLYAGAGIVSGSSPDKELAETGAKFNTMLGALGIVQ